MTDHLTSVQLTRLMQGEVSPTHEPKLHQHLDTCEICAAALEEMAGNEQVQEEVASLLRSDEIGDTVPYRDECSATDFVSSIWNRRTHPMPWGGSAATTSWRSSVEAGWESF